MKLGDNNLEEVETFTYLGSVINQQGETDADVKTRIGKARAALIALKNIWRSNLIASRTKIRLFNSNVKSVLLYGAEPVENNKDHHQKSSDLHQFMPAKNSKDPLAKYHQ